jgi:hypothetical protein
MGQLVQFPTRDAVTTKDSQPSFSAPLKRVVVCSMCRHEWELTIDLIVEGLWVTRCPKCEGFQSEAWHKEMLGR